MLGVSLKQKYHGIMAKQKKWNDLEKSLICNITDMCDVTLGFLLV